MFADSLITNFRTTAVVLSIISIERRSTPPHLFAQKFWVNAVVILNAFICFLHLRKYKQWQTVHILTGFFLLKPFIFQLINRKLSKDKYLDNLHRHDIITLHFWHLIVWIFIPLTVTCGELLKLRLINIYTTLKNPLRQPFLS